MSSKVEKHKVPVLPEPVRLRIYALGKFRQLTTNAAIKKALKKGDFKIDGEVATSESFVAGGECIELSCSESTTSKRRLIFPLKVLYEDDYLAVIHKPAGILVSGNSFKTIAHALPQNLQLSPLPDATAPQPVHRLDYATTGCLLVGKTRSSIQLLNQLFEEKKVAKRYLAVTIGEMEQEGTIRLPVDDKPAESYYKVLQSVFSKRFSRLNLVELQPATGRRHQLRKHLASIGHPILGDSTYCPEELLVKGKGLYLHAYSLSFTHPATGNQLKIADELPARFMKIFPNLA
jgi:23S rRNA pseudouridine1911/1915/1917 synthase